MRKAVLLSVLNAIALLSGCGSAVEGASDNSTHTSDMELRLVDTSSTELKNVVLTVGRVDVEVEGKGWSTVVDRPRTLSMSSAKAGGYELLGNAGMPSGHVKRFRIFTDAHTPSYVTTRTGARHNIEMPSSDGIMINAGFDLAGCSSGYITIDFNSAKTVMSNPSNSCTCHDWTMSANIRLNAVVSSGSCGDNSTAPPPTKPNPPRRCDGGVSQPTPSANPPSVYPPSTPPPSTTGDTPSTPPPASTPTTPASTPPDSCWHVSCGGDTCINGVCTVIIN